MHIFRFTHNRQQKVQAGTRSNGYTAFHVQDKPQKCQEFLDSGVFFPFLYAHAHNHTHFTFSLALCFSNEKFSFSLTRRNFSLLFCTFYKLHTHSFDYNLIQWSRLRNNAKEYITQKIVCSFFESTPIYLVTILEYLYLLKVPR